MDQPANAGRSAFGDRLYAVFIVLVTNAIPVYGVMQLHWSVANVLVLFWIENLLVAVFTCLRIAVHRALTRKRGHWRAGQLGAESSDEVGRGSSLLSEYATIAFVFTLAHGVFVVAITFILGQNQPGEPNWQFSFGALRQGVLLLAGVLAAGFLADLPGMRQRPFAWIRLVVQQRMGRVLVLHLAIIFGMMGMAWSGSPMAVLYVLIGLKTLADLLGVATRGAPKIEDSDTPPPVWTMKMADKLGKDKGGATGFLKKWEAERDQVRKNAIEDEKPMPADASP